MEQEAMIAYLPVDGSVWIKQDFPHLTLVYAGFLEESALNTLAKDAITAIRLTGTFSLSVTGLEVLGGDGEEKVDALVFYPLPQLLLARRMVEHWNASSHRDFLPHVTIGPEGSASSSAMGPLPTRVYFNKIAACWGDRRLIFSIDDMY